MWSRHAWLHAMHVLISSARPPPPSSTNSASARNGRAIDTMSASPRASSASATAGIVDPVGRDQRHAHRALQPPRHPGERRARHHRRDRRHARLVPADAGVDHRRARGLDAARELDDLVPRAAALDEVEHRQPVDDDEVAADRLAHARARLEREAHAVLERAAPLVVAVVGALRDELVDQVALGPHDLDAVVAGARASSAQRAKSAIVARMPRSDSARGLNGVIGERSADGATEQRVVRVAARVQDLHRDAAAGRRARRR